MSGAAHPPAPPPRWRCRQHRRAPPPVSSLYESTPGAAQAPLPRTYRRREPEKTLLYQVVRDELPTFLRETREQSPYGAGLPRHVEKELFAYLDCGILAARGFARVRCHDCGREDLVAFSCKGRGVCPSCTSRRMADVAAHLVDRVIPYVPVRHIAVTFPRRIRWHLAQDPKLAAQVLRLFARALFADWRRRGRRQGIPAGRPAAVTVTQRFSSNLQLNHHVHALVPDGLFELDPAEPDHQRPRFRRLDPPTDEDVTRLLDKIARRTLALLRRRGRLQDESTEPPDALQLTLAAAAGRPASATFEPEPRALCARLDGFSLDAQVCVHEKDRQGLERLCQYVLRPPLALERLSPEDDGRLRYRMKRTFSDGTREILLTRHDLLARLCALVPPPRRHVVSYYGMFAANAKGRAALTGRCVPWPFQPKRACPDRAQAPALACGPTPPGLAPSPRDPLGAPPPRPERKRTLDWADLLRRTFAIDLKTCSHCGGRRDVIAFITDPDVVVRILDHLGLPSTPPPLAPARAPPETERLGLQAGPDADYFIDPPALD